LPAKPFHVLSEWIVAIDALRLSFAEIALYDALRREWP
jgi:hypothetical protein